MVGVKKYLFITLFFLGSIATIWAQRGKDGSFVSSGSNIVNEYTYLTADASSGSSSITVNNSGLNTNGRFTANLAPGDLILIIQMQGATINGTKKATDHFGIPNDKTWGAVNNYNNAGLNEFAMVKAVPSATTIELECALKNDYTASGNVQVIRVPRYKDMTISAGHTLTADPWNGKTGALLVVEVENDIDLNGTMDMSALGFRGGEILEVNSYYGIKFSASVNDDVGGEKGEGIAGYKAEYDKNGGRYGIGAAANAGGGGGCHDAGGGGGSNGGNLAAWTGLGNPDNSDPSWTTAWNIESAGFSSQTSSGGGRGGYSFSSKDRDALTLGPNGDNGGTTWEGDFRRNVGGYGGRPLDYSTGRLFLGGGGGAGDQSNQNAGGKGGNGGGLIFIKGYGNITGSGAVLADGASGYHAEGGPNFGTKGNDGAGGGGGGGTIIMDIAKNIGSISLSAKGGQGGNQKISFIFSSNKEEAQGPGGGGGGGYIAYTGGTPTVDVSGGNNGTTNAPALSEFPPNGATAGGAGSEVNNLKTWRLEAKNDTVCTGNNTTLNALVQGDTTGVGLTFSWYEKEIGGSAIGTGTSFTTPVLNEDTVFYLGTCPGTYRVAFKVFTASGVAGAGPNDTICLGDTTQLTSTGGISYAWTPVAGLDDSSLPNPKAGPDKTTTYKVEITTSKGCKITDSTLVVVNEMNNVSAGPTDTICSGGSIQLTATGGSKYTWTPATGLNNPSSATPVASPTNDITYYVEIEDDNGCKATDSASIYIKTGVSLNITLTDDTAVCAGSALKLKASGGHKYQWTPSAAVDNDTVSSPIATVFQPTTVFVTVTDTSTKCSAVDSVKIDITKGLVINAGKDTTICKGGSVQLNASGGTQYLWTPGTTLDDSTIASPVATPLDSTVYIVLAEDNDGCKGADTVIVSFKKGVDLTTGGNVSICEGDTVQLSASGGDTYLWSPAQGLSGTSINNPKAYPGATTTYVVTASKTGLCDAKDSIEVTVNLSPTANFSVSGGCSGDPSKFTDNSTSPNGTVTSWLWDMGDETGTSNQPSPTYNYGKSDTFQVILVITDSEGCTDSLVKEVIVGVVPVVAFSIDTLEGCSPLTIGFQNNSTGGDNWEWDFGNGDKSTDKSPVYTYNSGGKFVPSLKAITSGGCEAQGIFADTIKVTAGPVADFTLSKSTAEPGEEVSLTNNSTDATKYFWDLGNSGTTTQKETTTSYQAPGKYKIKLVVENDAGCNDSLEKIITIEGANLVDIPNTFTPNDDGDNDTWVIGLALKYDNNSLQVYNRNGHLIYSARPYKNDWDGTYKGKDLPAATYYYVFKLSDKLEPLKGTISIIR